MSHTLDPFRAGPDVDAYIRRADFEQSCEYLAAKLVEGPTWVGICGPPGVGKTLLARLLLRRLARQFTVVHVPASDLEPHEVERWIAAQLGASDVTIRELAGRLAREKRPLLVALDEAQHASAALIAWLSSWCDAGSGGRAVLVWAEREGELTRSALARCAARVFVEPLGLAEVPAYVEAQLSRAGATAAQRTVLGGGTLERIALASGGNPREIQRLADAELAAHAWRTRVAPVSRDSRAVGERPSANAPRGDSAGAIAGAATPALRRKIAVGLLLALGATMALVLSR
jgi:type II secretory pathway predicted ATPase ExeA